ncbi:MAG TPA: WD40 repeat domain-containing protein, partial [Actinomycetota bacterium]
GRDPSFLLRGARLEQAETWSGTTDLGVGRPQLEYIKASTDRRDVDRGLEDERHEQEIRIERRSRLRLRALVAVFAVAAIVAATLTIVATDQAKRASDAARIARARGLAGAAISDLQADPERSVLLAVAAVNETRTVDGSVLPEAEEALHRAIATSRVVMTVPGAGGEVAWGSAGTFAATSSDDPGTIVVADEETGETVRRLDAHVGLVTGLAFHPDGSLLASTGDDGTLRLWDNSTGEALKTVRGTGVASQVSFTADGSVAAAMWPDHGLIRFVDTETQRVVDTLRGTGSIVMALSPDGGAVAVDGNHGLSVIEMETHRQRFAPRPVPFGAGVIAWSPDGRYLATGGIPGAMIWDAETGDLLDELPGHPWIEEISWSADAATLVTAGDDAPGAKVWDIQEGIADERLALTSIETERGIGGIALSPDDARVMAGATDLTAVKVWDLSGAGNAEWASFPTVGEFGDVGFLPDGRLVAADIDGGIRVHDLESGVRSPRIGPPVNEHMFSVSPDGTVVAIAYGKKSRYPGEVHLWRTDTGDELPVTRTIEGDLDGVDWSPDGTRLVIADPTRHATQIVDRSGVVVVELPDQAAFSTWAARFSPDGRLVATIGGDEERGSLISIWDWRRGELLRTMHTDFAVGLTFDPSGERILTMFGPPVIWDVETGARIGTLDEYPNGVGTVAFSHDGSRLAATASGNVVLFDPETGTKQFVLRTPDLLQPLRLAFNEDGSMLATQAPNPLGDEPGIVRVWALDIDDALDLARREVTIALSDQECRRYWYVDDCST